MRVRVCMCVCVCGKELMDKRMYFHGFAIVLTCIID